MFGTGRILINPKPLYNFLTRKYKQESEAPLSLTSGGFLIASSHTESLPGVNKETLSSLFTQQVQDHNLMSK